MYDVVIIGAGASGCAIARELSRYKAKILVVDKEADVCCGTSKANSAIVHAGYDCTPGSLMAKLNVEGNAAMDQLTKELDIPFSRIGSLVVCTEEAGIEGLRELLEKGEKNGVPGLRILNREELKAMEPNISDSAYAALYAPTAGIICPFILTIAMAENANQNGVEFRFDTKILGIERTEEGFLLNTEKEKLKARAVINAAGVYADVIHNMVSRHTMTITPRRGQYFLLDKTAGNYVSHTIFMLPTKMGKGVLVSPTIHGNLLVGPTAEDIADKEGTETTREGLEQLREKCSLTVKDVPLHLNITNFSGLRAHEAGHEFIIEEVKDCQNFFDVAGIESPGLSSSPAIGKMVAGFLQERFAFPQNESFSPLRKGIPHPNEMTLEERNALIRENPAYGNIICRCEGVSEGEILDAIHRPLGATNLDGIKRRTRTGTGRCQAGFCTPKVMEILLRERPELSMETITKCGGHSGLVPEEAKASLRKGV